MSAWASAAPVIGTGSLDGFAAGALMSVVCAMAITAPRRPPAARGGAQAADRNGSLCEHVMAAEAAGFGLAASVAMAVASAAEVVGGGVAAEAPRAELADVATGTRLTIGADESSGAAQERLARPENVGARRTDCSAAGQYSTAAGGYRSRHRLGDPIPFGAPRDGASPGSTSEQGAFPRIVAQQSPFPGSAVRSNAFADSAFPRTAFADSVLPRIGFACGRWRRDAHPDIEFSDAELALVPFASPRRPEAPRPPRHAAPSIGLRSRITGIGRRMTGLFATRALVSSARG